jgi:23S rRNA (pseudouridine1915-N3)-methyltransferase
MGNKNLVFIIGGHLGISQGIIKKADYLLSLSMMTFPHKMVPLMLLEQLYRSFTILNNKKYHK